MRFNTILFFFPYLCIEAFLPPLWFDLLPLTAAVMGGRNLLARAKYGKGCLGPTMEEGTTSSTVYYSL